MTIALDPNRTSKDIQYRLLTPELITKLCMWIAEGNYESTACNIIGITPETLCSWKRQAEIDIKAGQTEAESITIKLIKDIKNAEAKAESERVARINKAGIGGALTKRVTRERKDGTIETEESYQAPQWLADMTHLERRHPDRWGRRDQLNVDQTQRTEVTVIVYHEATELPSTPASAGIIEGEARVLDITPKQETPKIEAGNDKT